LSALWEMTRLVLRCSRESQVARASLTTSRDPLAIRHLDAGFEHPRVPTTPCRAPQTRHQTTHKPYRSVMGSTTDLWGISHPHYS